MENDWQKNESEAIQESQNPATPPTTPNAPSPAPMATQPPKKRGGWMRWLAIAVAVVLVAGGVAYVVAMRNRKTEAPKQAAKVKIGVLMAFSGGSSSMGYGAIKGVNLAKKQLNADNIELVQADGKCDPEAAPKAMDYLAKQHVVAIIGENCSSASVAVLAQANRYKIPLVSPSASSPKLSIADDYFFRTVPSDIGQGTFLAQAIYKQGHKTAAVFYTAEPYGTAINDVFKQQFEALGGKVLTAVSAPSSVIDVQKQVEAIKAANPGAIAIVTNSTVSSTAVMKLARQLGVTAPFYGGDNLYDNTIITNNGAAAEGLHVVSFPTGSKAFKQALLNEYNVTEQLYAAPEAYDAFHAIYLAVQKGAKTGEDFKRILPTIKFKGASGDITFDKYGEVPYQTYKYDLLEVKDGAFTVVELQ